MMEVPSDLSPLWISLKASITATLLILIPGAWAAWQLKGHHGKWTTLIESILTLPMILPPTLVGFVLLMFFGRHGMAGKLLHMINFSVIFNLTGAIIAATVVAFPLFYKTAKAAFEQVDQDLINAAKTLGAGRVKIFLKVVVPLAAPGMAAGITLAFLRALGEFGATLMIAGNIPGKTQTIPVALFFAVEGGDYKTASFWAIGVLIISILLMMIINHLTGGKNHANGS